VGTAGRTKRISFSLRMSVAREETCAAAECSTEQPESLVGYALAVLRSSDAFVKHALTCEALARWRAGELPTHVTSDGEAPDKPARDLRVLHCEPGAAPKRGKGGSLASRVAIVHSLAHIESWAIDLSWDVVARFGRSEAMPRSFFEDWAVVALEEASHFKALSERLTQLDSHYGALPAHDGLWESAVATAHSLSARLAVEHCTHEARGLDVLPQTIARFRAGGDEETAELLESRILPEEVSHCAKGVTWFRFLTQRSAADAPLEEAQVAALFRDAVRSHFRGSLKPPFNVTARAAAGFLPEWYEPQSS